MTVVDDVPRMKDGPFPMRPDYRYPPECRRGTCRHNDGRQGLDNPAHSGWVTITSMRAASTDPGAYFDPRPPIDAAHPFWREP